MFLASLNKSNKWCHEEELLNLLILWLRDFIGQLWIRISTGRYTEIVKIPFMASFNKPSYYAIDGRYKK